MESRKYAFTWELIGDVSARENLGPMTRVENYRLMQFTLRDVLERQFGTEAADKAFREAGHLAGREFCKHFLSEEKDFSSFVASLQNVLKEYKIGILRVEEADVDAGVFTVTVGEDLDCSGLPELDYEFCAYDEGFLSGIFGQYTGKNVSAHEVDCWCTGDRTCRFAVTIGVD